MRVTRKHGSKKAKFWVHYFWWLEYICNCEQPENNKYIKSYWVFEYKWSCYMWHQNYKAIPQFWVLAPLKQQLYYVLFLHTTQKSLLPTITTNPQVNAILQFTHILQQSYTSIQWLWNDDLTLSPFLWVLNKSSYGSSNKFVD